jgi:hypothetical protein
MSANVGAKDIVTEGLVLYLDAANYKSYTSGSTVWGDMSGNNNSGSLVNGPIFNSVNAGSIQFDGVDDYAQFSHSSILDFLNSISLCFWFKTSQSVDAYLTTKSNDSFYFGVGPVFTTPSKLSFFANDVTGGWIQSNKSVDDNSWNYGVVTWNGSVINIYINSVLDVSVLRGGTMRTGTNVLGVGARINSSFGGYLSGSIANAAYYNRALSAQEVLQNYNALKGRFGLT